ncbi:MAG: YceD family protein [Pseudoxanthomonas sp.]|jgi:uncharacterized protein
MSAHVPEILDAWRMVAARRSFEGKVPLAALRRLDGLLTDAEGEVTFALQFDRDALQVPYVELKIDVALPLECQRSLQRFLFPVSMVQKLGLIRDEADEAALPEDVEALLVPEDGMLRTLDLIEDELVLAVPAVPMNPELPAVELDVSPRQEELAQASPFAALASLKKN